MLRDQGLGYSVYGLGLVVSGLGFRAYKTLLNAFNKQLKKNYKILDKIL